jgi:hypothetical protein
LFCVKKFQGETMKQFTFDKVKSLLSLFPRFQPFKHRWRLAVSITTRSITILSFQCRINAGGLTHSTSKQNSKLTFMETKRRYSLPHPLQKYNRWVPCVTYVAPKNQQQVCERTKAGRGCIYKTLFSS